MVNDLERRIDAIESWCITQLWDGMLDDENFRLCLKHNLAGKVLQRLKKSAFATSWLTGGMPGEIEAVLAEAKIDFTPHAEHHTSKRKEETV